MIDYCHSESCKNGGTCKSYSNSFKCHCPVGWKGSSCEDGKLEYVVRVKLFVMAGASSTFFFNPLRANSDLSQTSHCNIKDLSVSGVMRIENMITQVKFF